MQLKDKNIVIVDNKADAKNIHKYSKLSLAYTTTSLFVTHKCNTNINPAEIIAAINKYMV